MLSCRGGKDFLNVDYTDKAVGFPFAAKTTLTHPGMDSSRPLKVCWGIRHQDTNNRSCKSCKLRGRTSVAPTCLSRVFWHLSIRKALTSVIWVTVARLLDWTTWASMNFGCPSPFSPLFFSWSTSENTDHCRPGTSPQELQLQRALMFPTWPLSNLHPYTFPIFIASNISMLRTKCSIAP